MKVNIEYFAKIREERGSSFDTLEVEPMSAKELYMLLKKKYKFSISFENLKVAVNEEFSSWDTMINENDTVVFIQPVAGG